MGLPFVDSARGLDIAHRGQMCESGHRMNHESPTVEYLANSSICGFDSPIGEAFLERLTATCSANDEMQSFYESHKEAFTLSEFFRGRARTVPLSKSDQLLLGGFRATVPGLR
jgi:hypothetical protein